MAEQTRLCVLCFHHGKEYFPILQCDEDEAASILEDYIKGEPILANWRGVRFRSDRLAAFFFQDNTNVLVEESVQIQREMLRLLKKEQGEDESWRESLDA